MSASETLKNSTVTLPAADYMRLVRAECLLAALEAGGVAAWDGYEDATDEFFNTIDAWLGVGDH